MALIHLGTQIQSVFGKTDDDGNVIERYAVNSGEGKPVNLFTAEAFNAAFQEINTVRAQLVAKLEAEKCPS